MRISISKACVALTFSMHYPSDWLCRAEVSTVCAINEMQ